MAEVGSRLGGLTLERELGAGGFGKVFCGRPDVGPPRAVKVLGDATIAGCLRREAETLLALRHPRIVELVHADLTNDPAYLVMELVEGGPLDARLPLAAAEARSVCRGLLEGLAHAHAKGIAHLDLKPSNVLMAADGPKLADFGLARAALADASLKRSGSATSISGTLAYMAPEVSGGEAGDARADMYSFGVMLCQMLTGKLPQPGDTLDELLGTTPPAWAQALFSRCYCRREKRLANATEALKLLDEGQDEAVATSASGRVSVLQPEEGTRPCPFCREQVLIGALKCKHCGERLDKAAPLLTRRAGFMCAVHHDQTAAANCVRCGNPFCATCLTEVRERNHCRTCVSAAMEEREAELEKVKDRAAMRGSGSPNIVVNATGGSASSSASAAATAIAGGGLSGRGATAVRLADSLKAAFLSLLWPGLGHIYISHRFKGILLGLAAAISGILMAAFTLSAGATHNSLLFWLPLLVLGQPWLLGPIFAFKAAKKDNEARLEHAKSRGASAFKDPLFRWTWMAPVGVDEIDDGSSRLVNRCGSCGYTWHPRGHGVSAKCPRCSSAAVQVGRKGLLSGSAMALVGCMGLCVLMMTITSISAGITNWEKQRQARAKAEADYEAGLAAYDEGRWQEAYTLLGQASDRTDRVVQQKIDTARKQHSGELVEKAERLEAEGKLADALGLAQQAERVSRTERAVGRRRAVAYQLGRAAIDAEDWDEAIRLLALAEGHQDASALLQKAKSESLFASHVKLITQAEAALKEGRPADVLKELAKLPTNLPTSAEGREPLGPRVEAASTAAKAAVYEQAASAMKTDDLATATDLFRLVGDFSDAPAKIQEIKELIAARKADEERQRAEKARLQEEAAKRQAEEERRAAEEAQRKREEERQALWPGQGRTIDEAALVAWGPREVAPFGAPEDAVLVLFPEVKEKCNTPLSRKRYFESDEGQARLKSVAELRDQALGKTYVLRLQRPCGQFDLRTGTFTVEVKQLRPDYELEYQDAETRDPDRVFESIRFEDPLNLLRESRITIPGAGTATTQVLVLPCEEDRAAAIEAVRDKVIIDVIFRHKGGVEHQGMGVIAATSARIRLKLPNGRVVKEYPF